MRQRVFGIACGYEDCNDAGRLAEDPMQKLLVDRDPIAGEALASQSMLSRFENALGPKALMRMGNALADTVIARHHHEILLNSVLALEKFCLAIAAFRSIPAIRPSGQPHPAVPCG